MKRKFTLLLFIIVTFGFTSFAQSNSTCALKAKFSFERDNGQPTKFKFNNLSTPAGDIQITKWSFGDGTYSSDFNTSHVYTNSGEYTVCLIVSKGEKCHSDTCAKVQVQIATPTCNLEAQFTWIAESTQLNKFHFNNLSSHFEPKDTIRWTFGDGTTSYDVNPTHTYASPGSYNVCIRIKKYNQSGTANCVKELCKILKIEEPEINCADISKFTLIRSTINCLEFKLIPAVQNPNWKYIWAFGDGTGSADITPSHVYPRSGNYTIFLAIYRSASCISNSHKVAETGACFSCNNISTKFEYNKDVSTTHNISLHAISNHPILSQRWTITNLSFTGSIPVIINQNNPVYSFKEPGDYRICLRAVTTEQCVKEYCEVIHVSSTNQECRLTAYPNPTHNQVSVDVQLTVPEKINAYIFNSLNILVKQKDQQGRTGKNTVTIELQNLVPGLYTMKIVYGNKICYTKFQKI